MKHGYTCRRLIGRLLLEGSSRCPAMRLTMRCTGRRLNESQAREVIAVIVNKVRADFVSPRRR